jgi:hypothetical protein
MFSDRTKLLELQVSTLQEQIKETGAQLQALVAEKQVVHQTILQQTRLQSLVEQSRSLSKDIVQLAAAKKSLEQESAAAVQQNEVLSKKVERSFSFTHSFSSAKKNKVDTLEFSTYLLQSFKSFRIRI